MNWYLEEPQFFSTELLWRESAVKQFGSEGDGGRGSAKFYVEFSRSRIPRLTWGSCSGRNRIVYCYGRVLNGSVVRKEAACVPSP